MVLWLGEEELLRGTGHAANDAAEPARSEVAKDAPKQVHTRRAHRDEGGCQGEREQRRSLPQVVVRGQRRPHTMLLLLLLL